MIFFSQIFHFVFLHKKSLLVIQEPLCWLELKQNFNGNKDLDLEKMNIPNHEPSSNVSPNPDFLSSNWGIKNADAEHTNP